MKVCAKTTIVTVVLFGNVLRWTDGMQCPPAWQRFAIFGTALVNKKSESKQEKGKVVLSHAVKRNDFPLLHENCHAKPMHVVSVHWKKQPLVSKDVNVFCV